MKRENCYYYIEYPDMGGHISCCAKYTVLGECPCDNCNDFLEDSGAEKIIEAYLKKDLIPISVIKQIKAEIKTAARKHLDIALSITDLSGRKEHLKAEEALNYCVSLIDRYIKEHES